MSVTASSTIKAAAAATLGLALAVLSWAPASAAVTFGSGHIDALAFSYDAGAETLDIQVEDHASATVYEPAEVTFDVHDGHSQTLPGAIACKADAGENWVIPRTEAAGRLWLGWSTEGIDLADFGGGLRTELVSASTPPGGDVSVYDAATGAVRLHTDPSCDASGTAITESHHHATWVFTEPGTYELTFRASGDHASAGAVASDEITYTFEVGGA